MSQRAFGRRVVTALTMLVCLCAFAVPLSAQRDASADKAFFDGKTITYIVASKPGGGYDTYGRLIAEFLEKHLPGAEVRVQNVPGAGHIVGLNQLSVAPADGLTIGTFNTGLIYAQLLERPGMRVDLRDLDWIGKAASGARVLIVSGQSGITSLDDLRNRTTPALFASDGVGSAAFTETAFLSRSLNLDVKIVTGYSGQEEELAMLRGEVHGKVGSYSSLRPFIDNGHGRILLRIGSGETLGGDVPAASNLVGGPTGQSIIAVMETLAEMGRLTAAPGGVPAARLEALRQAYAAALADPDLLARAAKLRIPIDPLQGDVVAQRVAAALNQPPEVVELMRVLSKGTGR